MANFTSNVEVIQRRKNCPPTSSDGTVGYTVPSSAKCDLNLKPKSIKPLEENIWRNLAYDTQNIVNKRINRLECMRL